jgi:hypothetical protein
MPDQASGGVVGCALRLDPETLLSDSPLTFPPRPSLACHSACAAATWTHPQVGERRSVGGSPSGQCAITRNYARRAPTGSSNRECPSSPLLRRLRSADARVETNRRPCPAGGCSPMRQASQDGERSTGRGGIHAGKSPGRYHGTGCGGR